MHIYRRRILYIFDIFIQPLLSSSLSGLDLKEIGAAYCMAQYYIFKNGILKLNSFNNAVLDKCISQYTEHPVSRLREYSVKYSH